MTAPLPNLWDDLSLRPYLGAIARRHGIVETLALPSMRDLPPLRIEQLFVQPALATVPVSPERDPAQWPAGQGLLETLAQAPQLVVLGDPGGGKTTLANWLAWRLSAGLAAPLPAALADRLPLPCILRDLPGGLLDPATTLADLARHLAGRLLGDEPAPALLDSLARRVAAGAFVLILDGVDEVPVPRRPAIASWVRSAAALGATVLATSRIVGYDDCPVDRPAGDPARLGLAEATGRRATGRDPRALAALRGAALADGADGLADWPLDPARGPAPGAAEAPTEAAPAWAQRRYLMPFDQPRIEAFVANWYRQRCGSEAEARARADDLLGALARSEVTRHLARTPNLLGLMAIVHRERAHLPDGRALLYDEIANAYINTIDQQRRIEPGDALAPYGWKARKAWLAYIGFRMQVRRGEQKAADERDQGAGVLVPEAEADRDPGAGVLVREAKVLKWLTAAMAAAGVADPAATAPVYMHWVARRSGLLLPRGEGVYAFVHLSFQEYFCATYLAERFTSRAFVRDELPADAPVTRARLRDWAGSAPWRETLVLLFELLSEQGPDWAEDLADTLFGDRADETDLPSNQAALAARAIADRHIRLDPTRERGLAGRCVRAAYEQWVRGQFSEGSVLLPLIEAGYAAIVATADPRPARAGLPVMAPDQLAALAQTLAPPGRPGLLFLAVMAADFRDAAPLAGLTDLRALSLNGTPVADCTPLAGLTLLVVLDLSNTPVADCTPLAGLTGLRTLDLRNTKVADCTPLAGLTRLVVLDLSNTPVADCTPLAGLTGLRYLLLINTPVADCTPLAGLARLAQLDLTATQVADCTPLAGLTGLGTLNLSNTPVADCTPLAGLTGLGTLNLSNTRVADCTPLAGLTGLRHLDLSNTPVADCTPLAGLTGLEFLDLRNTRVADCTPLAGLRNLQLLWLSGTKVTDISALKAAIPGLRVIGFGER